jgi:predicted DNA-binding transcriptional regulator YafY
MSPRPRGAPKQPPKLQRWIDLLAALVGRTRPVTFDELVERVPAYRAIEREDSRKRTFERDKNELRDFGVPIETISLDDGESAGYLVRARDFYLPFVALAEHAAAPRRTPLAPEGYRSVAMLAFPPDELRALAEAAARVRELGDPFLAGDADAAIRKLAHDLPMAAAAPDDTRVVPADRPTIAESLELLGDALRRRKGATFAYRTMGTDTTARRDVEPYGLFFVGGHWYLAARDREKDAIRNFRVSRIAEIEIPGRAGGTAEYAVPDAFDLREHARSRQAWEIGDGDVIEATVELRAHTGAALAAAKLGRPVPDKPSHRRFAVRRPDAFARWLLSFAGDLVPVAPASVVELYRETARRTAALYAEAR